MNFKNGGEDTCRQTEFLRFRHAGLDKNGKFLKEDTWINLEDEPGHQELCNRDQRFLLRSITEDLDFSAHAEDAVNSLRIAFVCDDSVESGQVVFLI